MKKQITLFVLLLTFIPMITGLQAQTVEVTFRVDMQNETVATEGVHMAGSFPAPLPTWNPAGISLTPPSVGFVYDTTIEMTVGYYLEYKFVNGDAWGEDEWVNGPCSPGNGNRMFTVPANDTVLEAVCYGSCLPCILPDVDVTFQVDMSNETVTGDVYLAGSFNSWNTTANPMTPIGNDIYQLTLTLGGGSYQEFKYLNGSNYETVPPECGVGGYSNRHLTVPSTITTLDLVCFGSCDPCSTSSDINVTFQVDMSQADSISAQGIHIAGGFQGWDPGATEMTHIGGGIYSFDTVLQSGSYHEYKFINHNTWAGSENVPWYCNNNGSRFLTVPESDTILPAFCFSSCLVCNPPLIDVKFQVDMSLYLISPDGVHLMGSFQDWDPATTPMTDMGNNIYEVTLALPSGEFHEYKFVNGNNNESAEFVPGECSGYGGNREFFVPDMDMTHDLVCFGYCEPCVIPINTFEIFVNLEGSFIGPGMSTDLHDANLIPFNQPYNTAPWNYYGSETYTYDVHDDVVDWVLLEFRYSTTDSSGAVPANMLNTQAALLTSNGSIVQTDMSSLPEFTGPTYANVYVVVWHRNHLAVMSANALTATKGDYAYDFTDDISKAYADGQKDLGGGEVGMIGGDSNGNGDVDTDDKNNNWTSDAGSTGYLGSDLNLDTQSNNPDKNDVWEPNDGMGTQIPQ